jgi:hypothetical protein
MAKHILPRPRPPKKPAQAREPGIVFQLLTARIER